MKKWWKITLTVVAVVIIAYLGISVYFGFTMTKPERVPVEGDPARWGLEYEDVSFLSEEDDITLHGWYIPAPDSERLLIIAHGAGGNRADATIGLPDIITGLAGHGYSILAFDFRGHGESGGDRISAGYYEVRDLSGAVSYAKTRGCERIGVLGFSMGASTAVMTAGANTDIDAVVADSSSADLGDIIGTEFQKRAGMPEIFLPPLLFMVKLVYGVDFMAIRPIDYVTDIAPRPVLFIHGMKDETIPWQHSERLYQASDNPGNQLWLVPEAAHVRSYINRPDAYLETVLSFFDSALK